MFEVSFNIDVDKKRYLDFVLSEMQSCIKATNCIVAYDIDKDRAFLAFACEDKYSLIVSDKLTDLLAEVFALGFKHEYLIRKLNIYKESLLIKTLLNTMTIFDSNNDKKLIKKQLVLQDVCAIDGYFNFRLKNIKEKWDEIINLTNDNSIVLSDENISSDFLTFLLDAIPDGEEGVKIDKVGGQIVLFDAFGKKLETTRPLGKNVCQEETALFNLVCLSPKKVVVCDKKHFSKEFLHIVEKFF